MPYRFRMATRSRTVVAITAFALLALTGCQSDGPTVVPDPTPTVPPIFESDEEALAAAEEAYGKYLAVSDEITTDGGRGVEKLEPLVTPELMAEESETYSELLDLGIRVTGETDFEAKQLQQVIDIGDGSARVLLYGCTDVSSTRVINASGKDVTPERQNVLPVEVEVLFGGSPVVGRVSSTAKWTGDNFCE